ncbi:sensor histidine kinase [Reinekea marinisedimentorum]|uniref:histidine kinase n=1 Tax=Reinekea marinisedimentorum TaxID=230495 RepID=A0A4R3IAD2_9GAMM|nr:HAMP domain-containing sensor histidine kinase [Reinekea marinisedimentorum]TCS41320.1 histidine kinase/DNA gyrase B/HSP90-like ATPase [Reinekea marinisedimentorum]
MDIQTLMASTVHDVKNSLGFIESQLTTVVRRIDGQDPASAEELRRIQLECARINNGMVHMLGLYRMQAGQFVPDFDEVLVTDVVEYALSRHTPVLNALGIEVTVTEEGFDGLWYMDSNLVEGILSNVVTNSIRYTHSKLHFLVREVDGWLNISIQDDGEGFPDKMIHMLDQPETLCFHSGATGLGLYFCQQIAQMHTNGERKGYVQLSNREDSKGAIFDLWLP